MSPLGAPFIERSLPPSSLNTNPNDRAYPFEYHVYEVVEELTVQAGPIRAWFEQPGMGTQFLAEKSVGELVGTGVLRLRPGEYDEKREFGDGHSPGPTDGS